MLKLWAKALRVPPNAWVATRIGPEMAEIASLRDILIDSSCDPPEGNFPQSQRKRET
jgi:hypothetical protein